MSFPNQSPYAFIPQQQQQQQNNVYLPMEQYQTPFGSSRSPLTQLHIDEKEDKSLPLMAVIVTIYSGSSYDSLFRTKRQEPPEGGRVSVWDMCLSEENMNDLAQSLDNPQQISPTLLPLFEDLKKVEPSSAVFNFECCSACNESGFSGASSSKATVSAVGRLLHHGYFVMASDFSLKALIATWDSEILGECPVRNVGSYSSNCELRFVPAVLKECASAQLVAVGRLCENGEAHVHAMGGTIAYSTKPGVNLSVQPYSLELLTVATKLDGRVVRGADYTSQIGDHVGAAGHVMLTYKTGGRLLLSSCHWLELSSLSTSEDNVFKAFEMHQGVEYAAKKKSEWNAMPKAMQYSQLQTYASEMVQSSAPCTYMKKGK